MAFAENSRNEQEIQPYKYNGKELDPELGLNLYDYHARQMDNAVPRFTSVDPLAEKYYGISPYVYCANNPMKFIDPTGKLIEKPIIWVENKPGSMSIYNYAVNLNYNVGDNYYSVFAHSNVSYLANLTANSHEDRYITTPDEFVQNLSKSSQEFKVANENKQNITIQIFGCDAAARYDNEGKPVKNSFAQQISKKYPYITVIAATGRLVITKDKVKGVFDRHEGKGAWVTYKKGKVVKTNEKVNLKKEEEKENKRDDDKEIKKIKK